MLAGYNNVAIEIFHTQQDKASAALEKRLLGFVLIGLVSIALNGLR
jgi:hypothetical protein